MCCVIEYGDGRYVVSQCRVCVRVTVHVTTDISKLLSIRQRELRQKKQLVYWWRIHSQLNGVWNLVTIFSIPQHRCLSIKSVHTRGVDKHVWTVEWWRILILRQVHTTKHNGHVELWLLLVLLVDYEPNVGQEICVNDVSLLFWVATDFHEIYLYWYLFAWTAR